MDKGDLASNNRIEQLRKLIEIAWSDGIMTDQESAFILQKAKEFGVPVDIVVALNAEVKQSLQPIPDHVLLEMRTLIELAMVDGHLSTQEEELIKNKGLIYNLSDTQIKTLIGEMNVKLQGKISPNVVPHQVIEEKPRRSRSEIIQELKKSVVRIECGDSNGAGVILHRRGIVITNHHVTPEEPFSGRIFIQFSDDDKTRGAFLIKSIPEIDIAFLGVDVDNERELPVAKLGNASYVSEGDRVFAIGHPMGLTYTVTDGIISAKKRLWNDIGYFQTNADINPGNSGGPLCNEQGEVVGINTFVITGTQGLNFALPVHYVEHEIEKIANNYEMHKGNFVVRMLDNIRSTLYSEDTRVASPAVRAFMPLSFLLLDFRNIVDVGDLRIISSAEQVYRALLKEYRNNPKDPKDYDAFKCAVPQYNAVELLRFIALSLGRLNVKAAGKDMGASYFSLLGMLTLCDPRLSLSAKAFFERLQTGEYLADLRKEQGLAPKKWFGNFFK
jgi:S1-C subfamily serine protease